MDERIVIICICMNRSFGDEILLLGVLVSEVHHSSPILEARNFLLPKA